MADTATIIKIIIRVVLLVASTASFIPQISKTLSRASTSGISLWYILVQFLSAGEQLFGYAAVFIENSTEPEIPVPWLDMPPSLSNKLDLTQVLVLFGITIFYVVVVLSYPPPQPRNKKGIGTVFIASLIVIIWPLATMLTEGYIRWRRLSMISPLMILMFFHLLINILVCLTIIKTYCSQVEEIKRTRNDGALSLVTLGTQAVVFLLLGIDWAVRMATKEDGFGEGLWWVWWFAVKGSFVVNNILFACVQFGLFSFIVRHQAVVAEVPSREAEEEDGDPGRAHLLGDENASRENL